MLDEKMAMRIWLVLFLPAVVLFEVNTSLADLPLVLVSDNVISGDDAMLFDAKTPLRRTGATHDWIVKGKYATDATTIESDGQAITGRSRLFDGQAGVHKNDRTYSKWSAGRWTALVVDLKQPYVVAKAQLWTLSGENEATGQIEVLTSNYGQSFTTRGIYRNNFPRLAGRFAIVDAVLPSPARCRFVEVRMHQAPGAHQQQLGELAIWALDPDAAASTDGIVGGQEPDPVSFKLEAVSCGIIRLDWKAFAEPYRNIKSWNIYRSDKAFEDVVDADVRREAILPADAWQHTIFGVEPESQLFFAITASYDDDRGERTKVQIRSIMTPGVFECRTFGDMLAVNHYPLGGGDHVPHANEHEWQIAALDMLERTPLMETRWFSTDQFWIMEMGKRGLGTMLATASRAEWYEQGNRLGVWGFSAGNEPDMSGQTVENYLAALRKVYPMVKAVNPKNVITAPTTGTEEHSLQWLNRFYQAGGKDYFDVLDVHPYCKMSGGHEVPPGVPMAAPEALFSDIAKVRTIMAKYDDDDKDMIATEIGYANMPPGANNPAGIISLQTQANYLVRTMVICHVLDFKRVYWYMFFDEGDNPYSLGQNHGLIDYWLQARPAYYALNVLGKQLGLGILEGSVEGACNPIYGYTYKVNGMLVNVLWDASGRSKVYINSKDQILTVVDLLGATRQLEIADAAVPLDLTPAPIYVHSVKPIRITRTTQVFALPERLE